MSEVPKKPPAMDAEDHTLAAPPGGALVARLTKAEEEPPLVAGRYEAAVYRARDRELDGIVALKILRKELASAEGMIERFRREVKLARRVTHRNVARTPWSSSRARCSARTWRGAGACPCATSSTSPSTSAPGSQRRTPRACCTVI